jgi:predicted RecA/RadA family phage recombinase
MGGIKSGELIVVGTLVAVCHAEEGADVRPNGI